METAAISDADLSISPDGYFGLAPGEENTVLIWHRKKVLDRQKRETWTHWTSWMRCTLHQKGVYRVIQGCVTEFDWADNEHGHVVWTTSTWGEKQDCQRWDVRTCVPLETISKWQ